jgi:hypothetical protein
MHRLLIGIIGRLHDMARVMGPAKNIRVGASLSKGNNHTKDPIPLLDQLNNARG